jgi:hypothetical protein
MPSQCETVGLKIKNGAELLSIVRDRNSNRYSGCGTGTRTHERPCVRPFPVCSAELPR